MKESQVSAMEEFITNVKILINALGYKVLEPIAEKASVDSGIKTEDVFYLAARCSQRKKD